jgi:hypothetical protein
MRQNVKITGQGYMMLEDPTITTKKKIEPYIQGSVANTEIISKNENQDIIMVKPTPDIVEPQMHTVKGIIRAVDGRFWNVGPKAFDRWDFFKWDKDEIWFVAKVGPHFDGLHFQTSSSLVTFELWIDGEERTDLVYIGKDWENPDTMPFTLDGDAVLTPKIVCAEGELYYKGACIAAIEPTIALISEQVSPYIGSAEIEEVLEVEMVEGGIAKVSETETEAVSGQTQTVEEETYVIATNIDSFEEAE